MNEAKYSFNIRFNFSGYDCQFTVRSDDDPGVLTLQKVPTIISELEKLGAVGERRWEAVKNGNPAPKTPPPPNSKTAPPAAAKKVASPKSPQLPLPAQAGEVGLLATDEEVACPLCGVVGQVELIGFVLKNGVYKQSWKCQACSRWLPEEK